MLFHKRFGGLSYGFRDDFIDARCNLDMAKSVGAIYPLPLFSLSSAFCLFEKIHVFFFVFFRYQINYIKTMYEMSRNFNFSGPSQQQRELEHLNENNHFVTKVRE